jgi:hypothetical protein
VRQPDMSSVIADTEPRFARPNVSITPLCGG